MMKHALGFPFLLALGTALLVTACGKKEEAAAPVIPAPPAIAPTPPVVYVTEARAKVAVGFGDAIARLEGSSSIDVTAAVSGYLVKQAYQEGAAVKKGDLLFLVDAKLPEAIHDNAPVSNPVYRKVVSPIDGVAGAAIPSVGDLVGPETTLARVAVVDPIRADFAVKQKETDPRSWPTNVELILADGTTYAQKGQLFLEKDARPGANGAAGVYALFPNAEQKLKPGDYAKVRSVAQVASNSVEVPSASVVQVQGVDEVRVVRSDNTVEERKVTTGERSGSSCEILSGVKAEERVIVEGGDGVRAGVVVRPELFVVPEKTE